MRAACDAGATEAEATMSIGDRFGCEARRDDITKLEQSRARSLSVRVFVGKKRGGWTTSDLGPNAIVTAAQRAVAAAAYVDDDPFSGLPDRAAPPVDENLGLWNDDVPARDVAAKMDDAREMERLVRARDPRIELSNGSRVDDVRSVVALANSWGFRGAYRSTTASRATHPIARDGEHKRIASYGSAARSYASLESSETVAATAVERAIAMCGARKPKTMTVPVIFERDVAASVLGDLFSALSAANVAVGNSFLGDRIGERIGSDLATFVDDGRLHGALGTSPFDSEGTPTQTTVVLDHGRLLTFLYDTYYARKLGATTTANASGGGIGPNTFYLRPGDQTLEALIRATPRGVLIVDTIGFATELASGTYSRGARGIVIEGGELAYPIDEFTIASHFTSILAGIDGVANDLRIDSSIVSPSFRVAEMTVSGT